MIESDSILLIYRTNFKGTAIDQKNSEEYQGAYARIVKKLIHARKWTDTLFQEHLHYYDSKSVDKN